MSGLMSFKKILLNLRIKRVCYWLGLPLIAGVTLGCGSGGGSSGGSNGNANTNTSSSSSSSSSVAVQSSSMSVSSASSSVAQSPTSHNAGQNCMNSGCHDGSGSQQRFYAAGTIYAGGGRVQTNATVNLYLHGTNTLVLSVDTDSSGNFYTTEEVDGLSNGSGGLVQGADVEVVGPSGERNMPGVISSGACSGCHGNGNGVITVQ